MARVQDVGVAPRTRILRTSSMAALQDTMLEDSLDGGDGDEGDTEADKAEPAGKDVLVVSLATTASGFLQYSQGDSARQDLEQLRLASIGGVVARTPVYSQWQRALTEDKKLAQDYQNAKGGRSM